MTMTANKNSSITHGAGGTKAPRETLSRSQSVSPPPVLYPPRSPIYPLSDSETSACRYPSHSKSQVLLKDRHSRNPSPLGQDPSPDTSPPICTLKATSFSYLDRTPSLRRREDQRESVQGAVQDVEGVAACLPLAQSTPFLGSGPRSVLLSCTGTRAHNLGIREKISAWEGRREASPRMNLCGEKREGPGSERSVSEGCPSVGCPSVVPSPCSSEKTFDFKGLRRMSRTLSECSYPETEEESEALPVRDSLYRLEKRPSRTEPSALLRGHGIRKESSAVLSRIQKIEQALKEQPGCGLPQLPSSCYSVDHGRRKTGTLGTSEEPAGTASVSSSSRAGGATGVAREAGPPLDREGSGSMKSETPGNSSSPQLLPSKSSPDPAVNPVPKPKRTFEYEADKNPKPKPSNGLPPSPTPAAPPPLPSTPAPPVTRRPKKDIRGHRKSQNSFLLFSNVASSAGGLPKENPYEDVDLKNRRAGRKSQQLSENSLDSLHRMWSPQDRKYNNPPMQLSLKPSSQSLRSGNWSERKSHRLPRLPKRHSHDDMMLLAQLSLPSSPSSLNEDSLSTTSELLSSRRARRIPKLVQRINSIYNAKRGKKRLKKLSLSSLETASLRDENSESESDSDDRFKAHTQRLVHIQSMLKRAPSYRTLELELLEWQERELFEYFVVVSLKKKPSRNTYLPEVSYQFPKLDRPTKQMREAEERLKAIPQFCFPDAKDWLPVSEYSSETFSFMLTGEDGSRRFGYCRRLLPNGKGPRLPEVYCVISRLGCFGLFSKVLDEVERRRGISAALVYPFMRSLMESPFPAPGKTIKVKTFLPGAGNEVLELRRPMDSRLEHVDFECLFTCLSVRQLIRIFASLLLERRVIFVADKLSTLSSCSHAVVALLYPFSWQHTFIPVLPASMIDIVCCPTPFLVGLLSSSLPKLKELPVEEALMVNLGSDRFIRQMDDEDTLLPRKLQAALEQALERKNELISQDSDSDSDDECNTLNGLVSEVFIRFFVETVGHYSLFLTHSEKGERAFQREAFRKSVASKSIRRFLEVFMESQMFAGFIQDRELRKCRAKGLFEQRVEQYLEELPDTEQSGMNKFLRGLGNKMKFLHKKN
ncbi:suppression of tumorigenicity 5 (predicted), isoform CRA_a [Rattus norvegicus]|uniref:Suppression of tumorigenicity 5 (Predicted), isoform CRA_a n=1 Tax=Rattus norvegicus TaxID=10116 RepID=A6I7X5_RAT|nr:suppression of tumorigenicity 5 (predicted), isoform CRA_a [Rattus norvegicus]EDM17905.1 suppression of tumorigenicity 5 (predicted), isoform CRA_a [Rattus norvegicus]EDM17907.1 suppression of tumorigenicity 5 (predicted), isoform CRA_a [Rattus norvegicus]EDM17909.1 suppression of tumorigenicity 5 (predicted), isoform CRA_a [Rattus norvegicus]|eukprot:NP_001101017.1 suppression of tumorigenicity 5 protein [Rattus norvegicus]